MLNPATIAMAVSTIAGMLESVLPEIKSIPGAPQDVLTDVEEGLAGLQAAAAALAGADAPGASSIIGRAASDAEAVLAAIGSLSGLPPIVQTVTTLIDNVLPILVTAVEQMQPAPTPPPPAPTPEPANDPTRQG